MPTVSRYFSFIFAVFSLSVIISYLHVLIEVSRLENSRKFLEDAVAKLQYNIEHPRRRQLHAASESANSKIGRGDDDVVVFYNRVPKTGSTSFTGIVYELCNQNNFSVIHVNISKNSKTLSLSDQVHFITNISTWRSPAFYHGHLAFVDFHRFGVRKPPVLINLIRDPLDRMVSHYYFIRYGDDFRPYLKRRRSGNHESFDQCVMREGEECHPDNLWMQIPFFCGHTDKCWVPGSQWALERAKGNVLQYYLLVGVMEQMADFIAVLEACLPRIFHGAIDILNTGRMSHLRRTVKKLPLQESSKQKMRQSPVWRMEQDFYDFVRERFQHIKLKLFDSVDGAYVEKGHLFHYSKIRPR